ncbi:hypothetical protein CRUP_007485 [Coryphaenoides rupestris]|nr:hypothetical protein CRUP_007485 [Coryphaenoides rupestris]
MVLLEARSECSAVTAGHTRQKTHKTRDTRQGIRHSTLDMRAMSAPAPGSSKPTQADAAAPKKKRGPGALATAYLVIYNVVMTAGWLVIAVGLVRAYLARGSYHGLYYSIEKPLKFFQTAAVLEILHCAAGIVPSSVVLTGFQVMSRVFLTWAVTHSVREIIRYSFYTFSLLNHLPYLIKWAR